MKITKWSMELNIDFSIDLKIKDQRSGANFKGVLHPEIYFFK